MKHIITSAIVSAALLTSAAPLAAKSIMFSGELELYNYGGLDQPFGALPNSINVSIELDEDQPPTAVEDGGVAQLAIFQTAVQSFSYDVFGALGGLLGSWSADDVQIQMLDYILGDGIQFFSTNISGPEPLNRMQLLFEGAPGVWSNLMLDEVTEDVLRNMTTAWMDINVIIGEGAFGARFAVDTDSITVSDPSDPAPSPVPLPAGLPLVLAGLGAFGLVRRGRRSGARDAGA
ncbi:VPLPA-CTERM sorting domain-containing protein [uncultured Roseobacter sp.]|uniref:VPLPA-CTERM sorting domain-containing protein n=1 Tax=uncultured Roseobacter sp. TaxID=114847 RepID=UPI002625BCEB|nr:VPLPA-CTERM sorting domain-containing protein [uncultured Roseobacter sp.]